MTVLIFGSTGALGRALADQCASRGYGLILHGRNSEDLDILANDIRIRYDVDVEKVIIDLSKDECILKIQENMNLFKKAAVVFFTLASTHKEDTGCLNSEESLKIMNVNFNSIIWVVSSLLNQYENEGGTIVLCGSIATARGRNSNIIYSACKRALNSYAQSLRHRFQGTKAKVQLYHLGFIEGRNTTEVKAKVLITQPQKVAQKMVDNLQKGSFECHYPKFWFFITSLFKTLPWFIFKRMKF
jgi:short-subunit dehydrogenase